MPNIARVLREEIQRLARKQVKAGLGPLKRENARLRKSVAELRRQVTALHRTSQELPRHVTPVVAAAQAEEASAQAAKLRPTSRSLEALRHRLGLTQVQFGKLLGVSNQAVMHWARRGGRVRMRRSTLAALAGVLRIGKREARRRLEALTGQPSAARRGRPQQ